MADDFCDASSEHVGKVVWSLCLSQCGFRASEVELNNFNLMPSLVGLRVY